MTLFDCIRGLRTDILLASLLMLPNLAAVGQEAGRLSATVEDDGELKKLVIPSEGKISVAIIVGAGAEVMDFCGPLEVFANAYTPDWKPLFAPYLVAESVEPVVVGGGMKVVPDHSFATAPQPKIIIIPAMNDSAMTPAMLGWIRESTKTTDLTMSVCNGSFVLAKAGLLSGKPATCHHGSYFRFAGMFPDVKLKRGARYVETGNLASSGGIACGIDLSLRVIERYLGHDAALDIADGMEYQGTGWMNADSNIAYSTMPELHDDKPLCPLCLMQGNPSISSVHQGKTICFCSEGEKAFFDAHTEVYERFLKEDAEKRKAATKHSATDQHPDRPPAK